MPDTDVQTPFGSEHADNVTGGAPGERALYEWAAQGSTIRSNAGGPAAGQSNKTFTGTSVTLTSGATIALETVAAGKTLYITDIYVGSNSATQFSVLIQQAGVTIFSGMCKGDTGPLQMPGIETQPSAPAGAAVTLVLGTAAATVASFFISGIEQ